MALSWCGSPSKGSFPFPAQTAKEAPIYAIREKLDRPRIISSSRHISQGGVDQKDVRWNPKTLTLSGQSAAVKNDVYSMTIHRLPNMRMLAAKMGGRAAKISATANVDEVSIPPEATETLGWSIAFGPVAGEGNSKALTE
jgi:hypothetical protein